MRKGPCWRTFLFSMAGQHTRLHMAETAAWGRFVG